MVSSPFEPVVVTLGEEKRLEMAKSALKYNSILDDETSYIGHGLSLYPNFSDEIPAIDEQDKDAIIRVISNVEFVELARAQFYSDIRDQFIEKYDHIKPKDGYFNRFPNYRLPGNIWRLMYSVMNGRTSNDNQKYIGPIVMSEITDLDRLLFKEPDVINDFIRNICTLPPEYSSRYKVRFEEIYSRNMQNIAWLLAWKSKPVPYEILFNYLRRKSTAYNWQWRKYDFKNRGHDIYIVIHSRLDEENQIRDATIHLVGLDNEEADKIRSGYYTAISREEFMRMGDHFSSCWYSDLVNVGLCPDVDNMEFLLEKYGAVDGDYKYEIGDEEMYNIAVFLDKNADIFNLERYNLIYEVESIDPKLITEDKIDSAEVVRRLNRYSREHPGEPIGEIALTGILNALEFERTPKSHHQWRDRVARETRYSALPTTAPVVWSIANRLKVTDENGPRRETPPEFIRRVYKDFLGKGISRADIRKLDRNLSRELDRYTSDHGMPEDLARDLPTMGHQEISEDDLNRWRTGKNADGSDAIFTKSEALRLQVAAHRKDRGV